VELLREELGIGDLTVVAPPDPVVLGDRTSVEELEILRVHRPQRGGAFGEAQPQRVSGWIVRFGAAHGYSATLK
jgi:hypothetical protein